MKIRIIPDRIMINENQVKHIAKLARIELTEKEKEKFSGELSSILDYVEQLKEVDTSKTEPMAQVTGLESIMREDVPESRIQNLRSRLLKQAPKRKGNYFKVPKILE